MSKAPNKTKGEYRPFYESMPDHPKFQCLTAPARLLLYVLKNTMGATGIQRVYAAVASERTCLPEDVVELAAQELERVGWIRREWRIWWIVDGLEHEPSMSLKNERHKKYVLTQVSALPRLQIVLDFLAHYGLDDPDPDGEIITPEAPDSEGYGKGYSMGYDNGPSIANGIPSPPHPRPYPHPQPSVSTTSPVVEEREQTAEGESPTNEPETGPPVQATAKPDEPPIRITDAELRQEALNGLGLGKYHRAIEVMQVNRELQELLEKVSRENLLAALKGAAMLRDQGVGGLKPEAAYTPGVLSRWSQVWYGEGDKRTQRQLLDVSQDVARKVNDDRGRRGSAGPAPLSDILAGMIDRGAA